jgi:hypothetical protein
LLLFGAFGRRTLLGWARLDHPMSFGRRRVL